VYKKWCAWLTGFIDLQKMRKKHEMKIGTSVGLLENVYTISVFCVFWL